MAMATSIVFATTLLNTVNAQENSPAPDSSQPGVEQFMMESTFLTLTVDVQNLKWRDLFQDQPQLSTEDRQALSKLSAQITESIAGARTLLNGHPIYLTLDLPGSAEIPPKRIYLRKTPDLNLEKLDQALPLLRESTPVVRGDYLVFGENERFRPYIGLQASLSNGSSSSKSAEEEVAKEPPPLEVKAPITPVVRPGFLDARHAISGYPVQLILTPPGYVVRTVKELMPTLPAFMGGGKSTLLTEGMQWAAIGIDPSTPKALLVIQSDSAAAAQALATHLPRFVTKLLTFIPEKEEMFPPEVRASLVEMLQPSVQGDRVLIDLTGQASVGRISVFATTIAEKALASAADKAEIYSFKQLGLAMHNYYEVYRSLPPEEKARNSEGQSGLSWRVHLLPYLGQSKLYRQFKLDEAWDSPHNIKLLEQMPRIFQVDSQRLLERATIKPGYTTIMAPLGERTIAGGTEPVKFSDVIDGLSNTIFFVEVKPELAVPWTAPQDYQFDPADPAAGLADRQEGKHIACFADGSVRLLPGGLAPEILLHLFQMNDENEIPPF